MSNPDFDHTIQKQQIDLNYDVFMRRLTDLLPSYRNQEALMRDGEIIGFFNTAGEAYREGLRLYPDEYFSIQEVTDEPINLGFFSQVAIH